MRDRREGNRIDGRVARIGGKFVHDGRGVRPVGRPRDVLTDVLAQTRSIRSLTVLAIARVNSPRFSATLLADT
jgi:hypothetical protein